MSLEQAHIAALVAALFLDPVRKGSHGYRRDP
jgi:hypothetical protein